MEMSLSWKQIISFSHTEKKEAVMFLLRILAVRSVSKVNCFILWDLKLQSCDSSKYSSASFYKEDETKEEDTSYKEEALLGSRLSIFNLRGSEAVTITNSI